MGREREGEEEEEGRAGAVRVSLSTAILPWFCPLFSAFEPANPFPSFATSPPSPI